MKKPIRLAELSATLWSEYLAFVAVLRSINENRERPRPYFDEESQFLEAIVATYVSTRNKRAREAVSDAFVTAVKLAKRILVYCVYRVLCVDGRISPVCIAGLINGGSVRVPAGNIPDFVRNRDGKLYLPEDSYFASLLIKAFKKSDVIIEILDSHRGCAAADQKAELRRGPQTDNGLYLDVLRKLEMKEAIEKWVEKFNGKHGTKKRAIVMHISSQPAKQDQNILIGLRKPECLEFAKAHGEVFSDAVLRELIEAGHIISSQNLINEVEIRKYYQDLKSEVGHVDVDWGKNYATTALFFWQSMDFLMKQEALVKNLTKRLTNVLPYLEKPEFADKLHAHLVILLGCIFNTYYKTQSGHAIHREWFGVITRESERVPFDKDDSADAFMVSTEDPLIDSNLSLQLNLLRQNRTKFIHPIYEDQRESDPNALARYVASPGHFFVEEVLEDNVQWSELASVDWSDLQDINWLGMSTEEFFGYLKDKKIGTALALAINNLRQTMSKIYDPAHLFSRLVIEGDAVMIPVIMDEQKEIKGIIPFAIRGYSEH